MIENILLFFVVIIFIVSYIGIVAPVIPSLPLAWGGIALYAFLTHFTIVDSRSVLLLGVIALVGTALDFLANILGAKLLGASWMGMMGAVIGSIVGIFFGALFGMLIGGFVGTFIGEAIYHKAWQRSLKAAIGTIIGFFLGVVLKVVLLTMMLIIFMSAVF